MSRIDYTWARTLPPKTGVYVTRRNTSKVHSIRFFDGLRWHDIGTPRRGGAHPSPFKWPKGAGVPKPAWMRHYPADRIGLRKITDQSVIQWGKPFKVYDDRELISFLVERRVLTPDWRKTTQSIMRARDERLEAEA